MFPKINYVPSEITAAGKVLANSNSCDADINKAEAIINEWRQYHFWPIMTIQGTLRNHVKRMSDSQAIVVQRLKKMQTIKNKLRRYPTMRLHKMQDIGGCRAIFSDCSYVYELCERLKKSSMRHDVELKKDYINEPKDDGYRGIHLIITYKSLKYASYNGLKVEIQIRTHLQHLWSTAVETVGTFLNCSLKSDDGPKEWLRFFKCISSLIALEEKCNTVPDTPVNRSDLIKEIHDLNDTYSLLKKLSTINATCDYIQNKRIKSRKIYVIVIKEQGKKVDISNYQKFEEANAQYIEAEKDDENNAVLVSATSLDALRRAYPNYFMNITDFLEMTKKLMAGDNL